MHISGPTCSKISIESANELNFRYVASQIFTSLMNSSASINELVPVIIYRSKVAIE
jgi:hypothetical protein